MQQIRYRKSSARVNRSPAQWRAVIDEHQQSGLTQEAFCKAHGVSSTALAKWRQRLGAGGKQYGSSRPRRPRSLRSRRPRVSPKAA